MQTASGIFPQETRLFLSGLSIMIFHIPSNASKEELYLKTKQRQEKVTPNLDKKKKKGKKSTDGNSKIESSYVTVHFVTFINM